MGITLRTIEIDEECASDLVRSMLIDSLNYVESEELTEALHRVIAYYSVPGEYENGQYDTEGK